MEQTREVRALDQVADLLTENHELRAKLAEAERTIGALKHRIGEIEDEIARLHKVIDDALAMAHGRWCEWGTRAEAVEMILSGAVLPIDGVD